MAVWAGCDVERTCFRKFRGCDSGSGKGAGMCLDRGSVPKSTRHSSSETKLNIGACVSAVAHPLLVCLNPSSDQERSTCPHMNDWSNSGLMKPNVSNSWSRTLPSSPIKSLPTTPHSGRFQNFPLPPMSIFSKLGVRLSMGGGTTQKCWLMMNLNWECGVGISGRWLWAGGG